MPLKKRAALSPRRMSPAAINQLPCGTSFSGTSHYGAYGEQKHSPPNVFEASFQSDSLAASLN